MNKWSRFWLIAFVLGVCLLPGCRKNAVEFTDDFTDPASGWGAASHETYVRGYQKGEYLIQIDVPQWFVWTTAGRSSNDVDINVTARSAGQFNNHFGIVCRYEEQAFYYFAVSSDGYYGIFEHVADGQLLPLSGTDMLFSSFLNPQGMQNDIRAVCEGDRLALYANGQLLVEVENDNLDTGDVGVAAGTLKTGGTSIWFDDFEVRKP
jgi:hypothetical protein